MKELLVEGIRYYTKSNANNCNEELTLVSNDNGVCILKLSLDFFGNKPEKYSLSWEEYIPEGYGFWEPMCRFNRNIMPDWAKRCALSKTAYSAPLAVIFDSKDQSRVAVSLSDVYNGTEIKSGLHEENAKHIFEINLFALESEKVYKYETYIRIDRRILPFAKAIKFASDAWRSWGHKDAFVPESARKPVYSTWYNFHQEINVGKILQELAVAKELGFETVIVDDGWQTDDSSRGYGYCGDWEVCKKKIPDMKAFVNAVHDLGMKFMLWYAVPFMGVHSKQYQLFKGKYLSYNSANQAYTLDPRYKEVRDYLVDLYERDMVKYGYDGFKLDFIDSIFLTKESSGCNSDMDCSSLEEGVNKLLFEIGERLRKINPEVLIEFRQGYFGPAVTSLGNMIRVSDCPNDGLSNRVGSVDLKMILQQSAVHSDMILWSKEESVEGVAMQLMDILFAVPQISINLINLDKEQLEYLKGFLKFRIEHAKTIDFGEINVKGVGNNYSQVEVQLDNEKIIACYSDRLVSVNMPAYIFNATSENKLYIECSKQLTKYTVYDRKWKIIEQGKINEHRAICVERGAFVKVV